MTILIDDLLPSFDQLHNSAFVRRDFSKNISRCFFTVSSSLKSIPAQGAFEFRSLQKTTPSQDQSIYSVWLMTYGHCRGGTQRPCDFPILDVLCGLLGPISSTASSIPLNCSSCVTVTARSIWRSWHPTILGAWSLPHMQSCLRGCLRRLAHVLLWSFTSSIIVDDPFFIVPHHPLQKWVVSLAF